MESLLITGASGFVGGNLARLASARVNTYAIRHSAPVELSGLQAIEECDLRDSKQVERVVRGFAPDVIVHTAALANVEYCARHRNLAHQVNVLGTKNIAFAAQQSKCRLIYLSSDLVFRGEKGCYSEEDKPAPLCHYGKTKLEGEKIVASRCCSYCIARVALVYGWSANTSKCFTESMIDNLKQGRESRLFVDEYRSPVCVTDLCYVLLEMAERQDLLGTYHVSGPQRASRYEFGVELSNVFGFPTELIRPASSADILPSEGRPKDCSLKNRKIVRALGFSFQDIRAGITEMRADMGKWAPPR
jgi:dTDP-4-dehydrorhamnose reductase